MTAQEFDWLVKTQLAKWQDQENCKRQQQRKACGHQVTNKQGVDYLKWKATEDTKEAQERLESMRTILTGSLDARLSFDCDLLPVGKDKQSFVFDEPKPNRDLLRIQLLGPRPTERPVTSPTREKNQSIDYILPFFIEQRLEREAKATEAFQNELNRARVEYRNALEEYESREIEVIAAYNSAVHAYNAKLKLAKESYVRERNEQRDLQMAHNSAVLDICARYEAGPPEAVEQYMQMVLERSSYPDPFAGEPEVCFDEASKTLIVSFWLPKPADIPNVLEHKYVASRKAIKPVEMKQKEFAARNASAR